MKLPKSLKLLMIFALILVMSTSLAWASSAGPGVSADEALTMLKQGNDRYVAGTPKHPNQDQQRRSETATHGQKPFATVIACSDSRVSPEILFDSGIGDIFVIRVAGNVTDTDEAGSIEYGVDHLGTPVMVVLGHTHCGAVTAVVEKAELHGNIPALVDNIKPAAKKARESNPDLSGDALIEATVKENVWQSIEDLFRKSKVTRARARSGAVMVLGGVYDIDSGKVTWMGAHPDQEKILAKYAKDDDKHEKPHVEKKKK